MSDAIRESDLGKNRREQMLKLVSKGFYKELVNYGVQKEEILKVASHLLDNVMLKEGTKQPGVDYYDNLFTMTDVQDRWGIDRSIHVGDVTLGPLQSQHLSLIGAWLANPGISELFVPAYPEEPTALAQLILEAKTSQYFAITCGGEFVGMVGGERIDSVNGHLEMKKLVGDPDVRGRGVGKRATFAFLYHVFKHLDLHKVYVHSRDINIRNINLNSRFGFVLEGIFLEDLRGVDGYQDVVRMALFQSFWEQIFGG